MSDLKPMARRLHLAVSALAHIQALSQDAPLAKDALGNDIVGTVALDRGALQQLIDGGLTDVPQFWSGIRVATGPTSFIYFIDGLGPVYHAVQNNVHKGPQQEVRYATTDEIRNAEAVAGRSAIHGIGQAPQKVAVWDDSEDGAIPGPVRDFLLTEIANTGIDDSGIEDLTAMLGSDFGPVNESAAS